ncbi:MAG: hypothetical protein ABSB58_06840 [Gemmatimonadales bacterium]
MRVAGRLFLFVGPSGSGKSTLTALLLARGNRMLGDDVLRFSPQSASFESVPRSLKLDAKTLPLIHLQYYEWQFAERGIFLAAGTTYVSPVALCTEWESEPGRPWAVVVLDGAPHEGPSGLERRGEGEAAVRLIRSVLGAAHEAVGGSLEGARLRLLESFGDAVAYQARGGDPAALADLIEKEARA